ncbi:MAG: hypothetical protein U1F30_15825 [Steroidobacteraceae bacterium]
MPRGAMIVTARRATGWLAAAAEVVAVAICALAAAAMIAAAPIAHAAPAPHADAARCAPAEGLQFICGPVASEELVPIPRTHWLVASGLNVGAPAHLYLIDATRKSFRALYPGDPARAAASRPGAEGGPAAACPGPPDPARMSLDGLALRSGAHRRHTLYVANHGDRRAVEIFELDARRSVPRLRWSGCLPLPPGTLPNALAALPGNGLLAISFHDPDDPSAWQRMQRGEDTGRILEWRDDGAGWRDVPDGATSGGNGLAVSDDGATIYASAWAAGRLLVLSRRDGARREIPLGFLPDNIHRLEDGSLLVAGQRTRVESIAACNGPQCPQPWVVARVDPRSGAVVPLVAGEGTRAVNYACGALERDGEIFITVRGDARIAWRRLPAAGRSAPQQPEHE